MTENFQIKRSFQIPLIAISYWQDTINKTPGCVETIESLIEAIDSNTAQHYLVMQGSDIYGSIVANVVPNPNGKNIYNVIILGGRELGKWKLELLAFIKEITDRTNTELCIITRPGWKKIFPELKITGYVYTL